MSTPVPFTKMHGLGNDYVVVAGESVGAHDPSVLARAVCDRRFGVGADGLLLVSGAEPGADFRMRMFNVDGSEAEMCGNGLRCAALFAREEGLVTGDGPFAAATGAGLLTVSFGDSGADIAVEAGRATVSPAETIEASGERVELVPVSVGNPHAVIFVDDVEEAPVTTLGPQIETHGRFPDRTNVEFVEVVSDHVLRQRTWERGCGETLACGTGACAVAAAAVATGRAQPALEIQLRGGVLRMSVEGGGVTMRGPAVRVFDGTWHGGDDGRGV